MWNRGQIEDLLRRAPERLQTPTQEEMRGAAWRFLFRLCVSVYGGLRRGGADRSKVVHRVREPDDVRVLAAPGGDSRRFVDTGYRRSRKSSTADLGKGDHRVGASAAARNGGADVTHVQAFVSLGRGAQSAWENRLLGEGGNFVV